MKSNTYFQSMNQASTGAHFTDGQLRAYYGAIYRFTTDDHTCEGQIELVSISEDTFEDNGHAIAWAMAN